MFLINHSGFDGFDGFGDCLSILGVNRFSRVCLERDGTMDRSGELGLGTVGKILVDS